MVAEEKQGTRSNSKDLHRRENDGSKTTQTEKGSTALVIMQHVADFFLVTEVPTLRKEIQSHETKNIISSSCP